MELKKKTKISFRMNNNLEKRLKRINSELFEKYMESREVIKPFLERYKITFPDYTDHSIEHSDKVSFYISEMLNKNEFDNLNSDEVYIILMASLLHDTGMGIPPESLKDFFEERIIEQYKKQYPNKSLKDFIREFHHMLSYKFIIKEYINLKIHNKEYAKAIAIVAKAHRKIDLSNYAEFPLKYFVRDGSDFICIPYLGCLLRIADELDITNKRISLLVLKYYPPIDETSKLEIEKHKSTILINFDKNMVIIKGSCSSLYIYDALNYLFKKIKETLNYCQKIIRNIGNIENKYYNLSINNIKKEIETINFIPKDISFSIDIENVFKHFISKSLYRDKYIAIREVLQNAIDTCRFKKIQDSYYNPRIEVTIESDRLIVRDNGLGMDEFIIKDYFTKLGKSYYQTEEIKAKFDSIAYFGIGVFSYFLICKYFEVNTQMKNRIPLRFRALKNPIHDFHFYDQGFLNSEGTEIIFYLKNKIIKKLDFEKLLEIIEYYMRDVEIPITVKSQTKSMIINKQKYKFNSIKEIKNFLKISHQDKIKKVTLIEQYLESENFRGNLGIFVPITDKGDINFSNSLYIWKKDDFGHVKVSISYKGIYVGDYYRHSIFYYLIGRINILSNIALSLDRKSIVSENYTDEIITKFEIEIIKQLIQKLNHLTPEEKYNQFSHFIFHSFNKITKNIDQQLRVYVNKIIYLKIFFKGKMYYNSIEELLSLNKDFIIFPVDKLFKISSNEINIINEISEKYSYPIFLIQDYLLDFYSNLIIFDNYNLELDNTRNDQKPYIKLKIREIPREEIKIWAIKCIKFNNNNIFNVLYYGFGYFNMDHPFIKFWFENQEEINVNEPLHELFRELHNIFKKFSFNTIFALEDLNNILYNINKLLNSNFILSKNDFPKWIFEKM